MGNKCIITKLNGTYNSFVPKFGQFEVDVVKNEEAVRGQIFVVPYGGLYPTDADIEPGSTATATKDQNGRLTVTTPNEDFKVYIGDYYTNIYKILHTGLTTNQQMVPAIIDITDITRYAENLSELSLMLYQEVKGKVYPTPSLGVLSIGTYQYPRQRAGLQINLNEFTDTTNLTTVNLYRINQAQGSVVSLGGNIGLNSLNIASTSVTGEIYELARAMVDNSRSSGTLSITCNNIVTIGGQNVADLTSKIIRFGSSMQDPTAEDTARGWQVA